MYVEQASRRSLSLGRGRARKLAVRAYRSPLVVVGLWYVEGHCSGKKPLPLGTRPWCDVSVAASNAKLASHVRGAGDPSLAVFGEEAQHASLLHARTVTRWLWSAYGM